MNPTDYDGTIINDFTRYRVGYSGLPADPAKEVYRHMLHLVAYDISSPRRLRRVAKICEDFGIRVEYSVFECDLAQEDFERLWNRLGAAIDADEDCILAYRVCSACVRKIESMGSVTRPGETLFYMP